MAFGKTMYGADFAAPENTQPDPAPEERQRVIGKEEIHKAQGLLQKYKGGKANLENRIIEDEQWYALRSDEHNNNAQRPGMVPEPTSAWMFNAILNKHADAMDNYPEPVVLPREKSDVESAKTLEEVLPVVLENTGFKHTYSEAWWEKIKHGTAAYGIFWDSAKENGLGDISIRTIDLLKMFWEPGVTDIQASSNLFIVELVDTELLDQQYPEHAGKMKTTVDVAQYIYDDNVETEDKSVVVDWYYKVRKGDRTLLHYVKFAGDEVLYSSEDEPAYADTGYYAHGLYPVVMDVMFPKKGTPVGFGYVAICKDPQVYIDKLSGNILESAMIDTKKRYFASTSTNINEEEFLDINRPIVHVEGEINDNRLKEIRTTPISGIYTNVWQMKIEELKDTSANRDVNSGGSAGSGITAASAIAALQEAGNKVSRDIIGNSYLCCEEIFKMCVELMRQFYDESRSFRVTNQLSENGYDFVDFSNEGLRDQAAGMNSMGETLYRKPVFDLKVHAQKQNPFSRMEMNENAKALYGMGFFSPDRATEALMALDMMSFEGIDRVREQVQTGQTLYNICQQLKAENDQLKAVLGMGSAGPLNLPSDGHSASGGGIPQQNISTAGGRLANSVMASRMPQSGYAQSLAKRSVPSMDMSPNGASPT